MKRKYYYTYGMKPIAMNVFAVVILLLVFIPLFLFTNFDISNIPMNMFSLLLFIGWFILHEILHGIGFRLSKGIPSKKIVYGMQFEKGILYCMCKDKIKKKDIFRSLLFPLVIIGFITLAIGIYFENSFLMLLSAMNIAGAAGDISMIMMTLRLPKDILYFDTDNTMGFHLLSNEDFSKKNFFALKLENFGKYEEDDETLIAHDFKKVKISKFSVIFMLILLMIALIINFLPIK